MDLFGAATMGVDPKTGSYLSKEQRVAMFRASRGQGGAGGGGAKVPGGGTRATVDPKSSIVAVKKNVMAVVETLQKNYQENAAGVAEQVARNAENINDLGKAVYENQKAELDREQKLLSSARKKRSNYLQQMREGLIEGMSNLGAAAGKVVKGVGNAAFKKSKGFLEKLKSALLLLGAAWVIDNLPAIEAAWKTLQDVFKNFPTTMEELGEQAKGAGTLISKMLGKGWDAVKSFGKKVGDTASWFKKQAGKLLGKVFKAIKDFVVNLVTKGVDAVKDALKGGASGAADGASAARDARRGSAFAKGMLGGADDAVKALPPATRALPPASGGRTPTPRGNSLGKMFGNIGDFLGGAKDKVMGGLKGIKTTVGDNLKGLVSGKPKTDGVRSKWLTQALEPILKIPGLGSLAKNLGKLTPMFSGLFKLFPPLGFAIDLAINKGLEGRSWTEAIIGAIGSNLIGTLGMGLGGKIGFGVGGAIGQAVIPIPGVGFGIGASIGSALGAAIGAMVGGQLGDEGALRVQEAVTGEERTSKPTIMTGVFDAVGNAFNMTGADAAETLSSPTPSVAKFSGLSTPIGMDMTEAAYGSDVQFIDMPPEIIDMTSSQTINPEVQMSEAEDLVTFATRDVDMDDYRVLSANEYQLAY